MHVYFLSAFLQLTVLKAGSSRSLYWPGGGGVLWCLSPSGLQMAALFPPLYIAVPLCAGVPCVSVCVLPPRIKVQLDWTRSYLKDYVFNLIPSLKILPSYIVTFRVTRDEGSPIGIWWGWKNSIQPITYFRTLPSDYPVYLSESSRETEPIDCLSI